MNECNLGNWKGARECRELAENAGSVAQNQGGQLFESELWETRLWKTKAMV